MPGAGSVHDYADSFARVSRHFHPIPKRAAGWRPSEFQKIFSGLNARELKRAIGVCCPGDESRRLIPRVQFDWKSLNVAWRIVSEEDNAGESVTLAFRGIHGKALC